MPNTATPNAPADTPLADLVTCLVTAKAVEETARKTRIEWEERIAEKVGGPEDGAKTFTLEDKTKITVTRGFLFDADCEAISKLFRVQQYDHAPPIKSKTTTKLDETAYKAYAKRFPATYRAIQQHVTVKPKKTSVVVKAPKA